MKFKSDIEVQASLKDSSGAAGTSGQVLSSTASGVSWVSQSGFVPYTGAIGDVDLGIHQLKADSLAVSTTSIEGVDAGEIVWNSIDGTFDMGLIGGVTLQAGQEMYIYGKATGTILNGEAVMFAGVQGDHILIARADAATINANPEYFIGVSTQDFATNDFGYVTVFGNVRELNTTAYTLGTVLYYNSASATDGLLTFAVPTAPNAKIEVAAVVRVHATQGILLVRPHVMPKIKDIQDVYAPSPSNDHGLWWNASTSRYENNSIAGILGYTPADDANVVKLTGNQTINGEKTFAGTIYSDNATYLKQYTSFSNQTDYTNIGGQLDGIYIGTTSASSTISMTNLTAFRAYELPDASGTIALTSDIAGYVPYTGATSNVNLGSYSITANSFIKVGGNSTQYLKADGSVSTAMNSRIEVNFIATSGQTTFVTPYEVGQVDVYYNGSKLYPNEFTATNGTDIILATGATLNAQISIVKYVSSLSTTAIRNETTFTTTAGQTTFSVNYSVGQVDVFYNGSKLNISEFTATNGTSVVLGFACAAGESVVIDSYVNQISGASGTANKVAKFTGVASLGDSSISDNGAVVSLTNSDSRLYGGDNVGRFIIGNPSVTTYLAIYGSSHATLPNFAQMVVNNTTPLNMFASGNVFIGSSPVDAGYKLDVNGTFRASSGNANSSVRSVYTNSTAYVTNGYSGIGTLAIENTSTTGGTGAGIVFIPKTTTGACIASIGAINESNSYASSLVFQTREVSGSDNEKMRVTSRGSLLIGATSQSYNPSTQGYMLGVKSSVGQSFISIARSGQSLDSQGMIIGLDTSAGYVYMRDNVSLKFFTNDTERMIIDQTGVIISIPTYNNTTGAGANMYVSAGGAFCRSTSSLKYKKNVEDYSKGLNEIMQMRPVTYESINEEEDGVKYAGLIAEEIHNLGLTEFVQYAEDGTPDALSYANMVSLLVKGMQELTERIKILENK